MNTEIIKAEITSEMKPTELLNIAYKMAEAYIQNQVDKNATPKPQELSTYFKMRSVLIKPKKETDPNAPKRTYNKRTKPE